ncbi:target of Nesh-SH3 isoform X2 [Oryzias melastigma]|uniref:target of Nesh-SH3 isoform X2 n=1 Tax=Oryzias melastigma TaxID=30732 RepID=UPI00168CB2BD|nr:target of Nesh-SH3 isoform X2 [Oryzias melastigma]
MLVLLLLGATFLLSCIDAQSVRARHQNMKVRINATGDTIVMKFVRSSAPLKLEGYILGYGSRMFSRQFIQLPEGGQAYETEMDAEPKYLVAVQPVQVNDVKKTCTGKVNLEKMLHLVITTVSPTAVLLSWGNHLKTPYEGNILKECLEDGFYTIRFRERNREWIYQTCPTSDTVIDNLKPNTPYEFGVRSNKDERSGLWSKSLYHSTSMGNKNVKPVKMRMLPRKPTKADPFFPPRLALLNGTRPRSPSAVGVHSFPGSQHSFAAPHPPLPKWKLSPLPDLLSSNPLPEHPGSRVRNDSARRGEHPSPSLSKLLPNSTHSANTKTPSKNGSSPNQTTKAPSSVPVKPPNSAVLIRSQVDSSLLRSALANERAKVNTWGQRNLGLDPSTETRSSRPTSRNPPYSFSNGLRPPQSSSRSSPSSSSSSGTLGVNGQRHRGFSLPKQAIWSRHRLGSPPHPVINTRTNQVAKPGETNKENVFHRPDKLHILQPKVLPVTSKPTKQDRRQSTTATPTSTAPRQETWEESELFKSQPASDLDAMGKQRYIAPHVIYQTGKKPEEPCSITTSLSYFPEEDRGEANVTSPPRNPPSNLTVVTVEGCPSFVILDWQKTDNDTTEYEVISTSKGPDGEQVSVLTTNQTYTPVENLKPDSTYEFKVKPKNELGAGPPSEPVSFNTESADPRVSENVSGKDAIWTQFPFKTDSYSDCHGKQYVKRTWYRKFVGVQLCNSLRYKIYLSDSLNGEFYNIGDQSGFSEDHCQFVDSFLDGRTGRQLSADQLPPRSGFYRALRQEPVSFGPIGGHSHISYVSWYECGTPIPGKW